MNKNLNLIINIIKEKLALLLKISLAIFLFILFFQPFPLEDFNFNNTVLVVAGIGAIILLFMIAVLILISFPWMSKLFGTDKKEPVFPYYVYGVLMVLLSSVALAFYLHYVGSVDITFFIMFKIVLICLAPPIILRSSDIMRELRRDNDLLRRQMKTLSNKLEKYEGDHLNRQVEFISENSAENIMINVSDVVFVKSADNYVEINYIIEKTHKKHLVRNTLKNIEELLLPFSNLLRCHRTYIVNLEHSKGLTQQDNNYMIRLQDHEEVIPVSRQYIVKIKEAFKTLRG
jgi:DNA-binding LytR/AlgR family response regulator